KFTERLPLADIAAASGVSQRTLTRLFARATGLTPLRYQQQLRTERAEHLIGHGATVQAAARAAGFEDARRLRRLRARPGPLPGTATVIRSGAPWHRGPGTVPAMARGDRSGPPMPTTTLGPGGPAVSRIGLGLAALGRPAYINSGRQDDLPDRSVAGLRARSF